MTRMDHKMDHALELLRRLAVPADAPPLARRCTASQ